MIPHLTFYASAQVQKSSKNFFAVDYHQGAVSCFTDTRSKSTVTRFMEGMLLWSVIKSFWLGSEGKELEILPTVT